MAAAARVSSAEFAEHVIQSGLVSARTIHRLLKQKPDDSPKEFADQLLSQNLLTPYQAKRLLAGESEGLVLDSFQIREFIGKGGMGSVFLAWDKKRQRECALKLLLPNKRQDKRSIRRFEREMEITRHLSHPAITLAYDSGIADGQHYLALEYVPGMTLFHWTKKRGPASIYWAARWFGTMARALDHAHAAGVIHRDLKPSNVIIRPDGNAKLLDLGLARWQVDDHNEAHVIGKRKILGSFDYIAPEQATDSASADPRSDVYSLGCVLYFALTGRAPFHHVRVAREKLEHHQSSQPTPLARRRPEILPEFAAIVERMMSKQPNARFQSCGEVADILGDWEKALRATTKIDLSLFDPNVDPVSPSRPKTTNSHAPNVKK